MPPHANPLHVSSLLVFEPRVLSKAKEVREVIEQFVVGGRVGVVTARESVARHLRAGRTRRGVQLLVYQAKNLDDPRLRLKLAGVPWTSVVTAHEYGVAAAQRFAAALGIPMHSGAAVLLSRHKPTFRRFVQTAFGPIEPIRAYRYWPVEVEPSGTLLHRIRRRVAGRSSQVIVKPAGAAGSRGVEEISLNPRDAALGNKRLRALRKALVDLRKAEVDCETDSILVEERLTGEEFSLECCCDRRSVQTYAVHWKVDIDSPSARFLERLMVSLPRSLAPYALLREANEDLLRRMGVGVGAVHPEYRVDVESGIVYPLEVALRPGGGVNSSCVELMNGFGLFEAAFRTAATGRAPAAATTPPVVACGEVIPSRGGVLGVMRFRNPLGFPESQQIRRGGRTLALPDAKAKLYLNGLLRGAPRARVFDRFLGPLLHGRSNRLVDQVRRAFRREGSGVRAAVASFKHVDKPGTKIGAIQGAFVGGINVVAHGGLRPAEAVAEAIAGLELCLQAVVCDPI
jgi:hypothetical protein